MPWFNRYVLLLFQVFIIIRILTEFYSFYEPIYKWVHVCLYLLRV